MIVTICLWWIGMQLEVDAWYYILLVLKVFIDACIGFCQLIEKEV